MSGETPSTTPSAPPRATTRGVLAIVLTYDAPKDTLTACVDAIRAQRASVEEIVVVDNASAPPISDPPFPDVRVLRLPENLGPAGGYAAGLRAFLESGREWAWLVDDDSMPRVDALEAQLRAAASSAGPTAFLATMLDRETGAVANTHGWCGVLVPRTIVDAVGLPREELFWWSEDTEYLQWRIPNAGFGLQRCDDAVVEVELRRPAGAKPAWKYYYECRNQVFFRLHVQRQPERGPRRRHLTARVRWWRATRAVTKLAARAAVREPNGRARKVAMVLRGALDGLRGRLGRTVAVDVADRPVPAGTDLSNGRREAEEALDLDQT